MGARHPLPYAYAKAHQILLEGEADHWVVWVSDATPRMALAEVLRHFDAQSLERETAPALSER